MYVGRPWFSLDIHIYRERERKIKRYIVIYTFILQIFTEDTAEVEALPRDKILHYLEEKAPDLVTAYLVSEA